MNKIPIIGGILKVVTFMLLLLLLLVYISPFISPERSEIFPLIGLGAPIIMLLFFIVTIYWIICWDRVAIVCVVAVLCGVGYMSRMVQVPVLKKYEPTGKLLKIATYNAHFFTTTDHKDVMTRSINYFDTLGAGVICFQEFATSKQHNIDDINELLSEFPYRYVHPTKDASSGVEYYSAIYSKYKIVNRGQLHFNTITNSSIFADIIYRSDTVRIFNNHLQSNNVTSSDIKFLSGEGEPLTSENSIFRMFSISKKLSFNNGIRASQADSINKMIKETPYSVIVCGDHNVTPISYTYNRVRGDLQDAFMNCGSWYGYTFKSFGKLLRIDYIFHSDKFETMSYKSPDILWSDHKPVIVELKYNK